MRRVMSGTSCTSEKEGGGRNAGRGGEMSTYDAHANLSFCSWDHDASKKQWKKRKG